MSQTELLYNLLNDGKGHSTLEILERVYGNDHLAIARIGARVWDIKKKYGIEIECKRHQEKKTVWIYKIITPPSDNGETCKCGGVLIPKKFGSFKFRECWSCKTKIAA